MIEDIRTKRKAQLGVLTAFAVFLSVLYSNWSVAPINSTTLAFSYKYGFTSRGLVGTLFNLISTIIPGAFSVTGAMLFSLFFTILLYTFTLLFVKNCMDHVSQEDSFSLFLITVFLLWFMCPMFVGYCNLGRLDVICILCTLGACVSILNDRHIYLCIPLCALGVMAHEGYVFMFSGIVLALLFYRMLQSNNKRRRDYLIVLILTFMTVSALFVWFTFLAKGVAAPYYDEIKANAVLLSDTSEVFEDVLTVAILGESLQDYESSVLPVVFKQFLVFVVMMAPYIVLLVKFFVKLIRKAPSVKDKISYLALALGIITIAPEIALKLDYGRWAFCIILYYSVVIILTASIDKNVMDSVKENLIPKNKWICLVLLFYPAIFQPLLDANVSLVTKAIARIVFGFKPS